MRRIALTLIATLMPLAASAASNNPLGDLLNAARTKFTNDKAFGCVNPDGDDIKCQQTDDTNFTLFLSPDEKRGMVFVTYLPDATGNSVQSAAILAELGSNGWVAKGHKLSVGDNPRNVKFTATNVTFVSVVMKPGDARINPTGRKSFSVAY